MVKRVALFIPSLAVGGAEKVFVTLANSFVQEGYKVDLVTLKASDALSRELCTEVNYIKLKSSRLLLCLPRLAFYLFKFRPSVLISGLQPANFICALACLISFSSSFRIVTEHSNSSSQLHTMNYLLKLLVKSGVKWSYNRANAVVAVSAGVKKCLIEDYNLSKDNVIVIHNPVDLKKIRYLSLEKEPLDEFFYNSEPVLVAVGRLTFAKNYSLLLNAVSLAIKSRPLRVIIIGDGELRPQLENEIDALGLSEIVKIIGFRDNPYPYMALANLLVVSSVREGFSNVIVESLALGTPVVSTNCKSGPSEILENGLWGTLVPLGSSEELADGIIKTLNKGKDVCFLRAQDFSDDRIIKKYIEVFDK